MARGKRSRGPMNYVQAVIRRPRRRAQARQAAARRTGGGGGGVESGLDSATRGVAGAQSMAMIVGDPLIEGFTASKNGEEMVAGLTAFIKKLKTQPVSVYWTGQAPRISAEWGIGGRKVVKSVTSSVGSWFRRRKS